MQPHGNPTAKIWVVIDKPYDNDSHIIFDGSYGWHFHKMYDEAGLPSGEKFITAIKPDPKVTYDDEAAVQDFANEINRYKPPFIIVLGEKATGNILPATKSFKKPNKPRVESFAGSLLTSPLGNYEHYATCTHAPDTIIGHYDYRDILVNLDLARIREEYQYYTSHGNTLNPLPSYNITCNPSYEELMEEWLLGKLSNANLLSADIETIRARKSTLVFRGNPGFPYLMGLADSGTRGVSFSLWNYPETQLHRVWRELNSLLSRVPQVGQNYFNFDAHYLEAIGYELCLNKCWDTMIRHHLLWPELPHSLQFLTKQYTRQPFYKDEGKGFKPSGQAAMLKYMHYNGLDACVTYQIYEEQERELSERPSLR